MKKHGFPTLLAALVSSAVACGDDGSATPGGSGTTSDDGATASMTGTPPTGGPTTEGPTSGEPGTTGSADEGTATGPSADETSDDGTATDGPATGSTGGADSGTGTGTEGGSSSEGSSSGGALPNCDAGDGPDFSITNNGFTDYVIDGVNDPDLTVVRGCSYTFTVNAPGHPFLIKTVQGIGLANTYDDGVTNQGVQNGVLSWDVAEDAPNTLFYDCQFHLTMAGTITVIDG